MKDKDALTLLTARAKDLAKVARRTGCAAGDFLTPAEQAHILTLAGREFSRQELSFYGGYPDAERKVAVFCDSELQNKSGASSHKNVNWDQINWDNDNWWEDTEPAEMPSQDLTASQAGISILCVCVPKGAEMPTHRDFLGTLMGLGLERSAVGDIVIKDREAWLFVKDTVAEFLLFSLTRVGRSPVKIERRQLPDGFLAQREKEDLCLTVASLRADVLVAAVAACSREEAKNIILDGRFCCNYLPVVHPEHPLKEGDMLSVPGKGRYLFSQICGQTKKGRLRIVLQKYV